MSVTLHTDSRDGYSLSLLTFSTTEEKKCFFGGEHLNFVRYLNNFKDYWKNIGSLIRHSWNTNICIAIAKKLLVIGFLKTLFSPCCQGCPCQRGKYDTEKCSHVQDMWHSPIFSAGQNSFHSSGRYEMTEIELHFRDAKTISGT